MLSDLKTYLGQCWRAALTEWSRGRALASLIAALLALPLTALIGNRLEWTPWSTRYIAIFVATWAFLLVLVVTPYRLWAAQRREIGGLKDQVDVLADRSKTIGSERRKWRGVAHEIGKYLGQAEELRTRQIANEDELRRFEDDLKAWRDAVAQFIRENIGHTDARQFAQPGMSVGATVAGAFNPTHSSRLHELAMYRERLEAGHAYALDRGA